MLADCLFVFSVAPGRFFAFRALSHYMSQYQLWYIIAIAGALKISLKFHEIRDYKKYSGYPESLSYSHGFHDWIFVFTGMTLVPTAFVIPAKAGIQRLWLNFIFIDNHKKSILRKWRFPCELPPWQWILLFLSFCALPVLFKTGCRFKTLEKN